MRAEFYSRDLVASFECFNMTEWAEAVNSHHVDDGERVTDLIRKAKRLFRALGLDVCAGVRELETAVFALVRAFGPRFEHDNSSMWALVLTPEYAAGVGPLVALPRAIQFYISVADGSCDLERSLGTMVNIMDKHEGPLSADGATTWALVELAIDGPRSEAEVFTRPLDVTQSTEELAAARCQLPASGAAEEDLPLRFTEFSRICAQRWLNQRGLWPCRLNQHRPRGSYSSVSSWAPERPATLSRPSRPSSPGQPSGRPRHLSPRGPRG